MFLKIFYFFDLMIKKFIYKKIIIAIKYPAAFRSRIKWGDYNVACDLSQAINFYDKYYALPVALDFWYSKFNIFVDVTILLRGMEVYRPIEGQTNILWRISHMGSVSENEKSKYDIIYTLRSVDVPKDEKTLPAFANTNFYYYVKSKNKKYKFDILFIGNSRNEYRKVVKYCIENGLNISVIGSKWEQYIDKKYIVAKCVPNKKVKYYYSNSKIILADHYEDMKLAGAISNRIYNISACKGFCICDDVANLSQIFKSSIPTFQTEQELIQKIHYYLKNPQEREKLAQKAYEITMQKYTAKNAAETIIRDYENYLEKENEKIEELRLCSHHFYRDL